MNKLFLDKTSILDHINELQDVMNQLFAMSVKFEKDATFMATWQSIELVGNLTSSFDCLIVFFFFFLLRVGY